MSHPDLDCLTAWVHGLLPPDEEESIRAHVAFCQECRESADDIGEEARILAREILPPGRAEALKARILEAAGRRPSRWRGALWQIPAAAALLFGLLAVLLPHPAKHRLEDGRVALPDGSVASAPLDLDGSRLWQIRALEKARVQLRDRTTVELGVGTRIALSPVGPRGVRTAVSSGEATFAIVREEAPLTIEVPAGQVDSSGGTVTVRFVVEENREDSMKQALAGALITLVAGSASLSTPNGVAEARAGQSAILAPAEAPLLVASPQDKQDDLLRKLEELVARITKLEAEVTQLEAKNKQLKAQLQANAPGGNVGPGGAVWVVEGDGVQVNPGSGTRVERTLRFQLNELNESKEKDPKNEKKPEPKAGQGEK